MKCRVDIKYYSCHTHHIDAAMVTMMNPIVPNDGVAPCTNLHPSKCVAMNIVILQNTTPTSKEVHAPLKAGEDLVVA